MMEKLNELTLGKALLIGLGLMAFYYFAVYDDGSIQISQIENGKAEIQKNQAELTRINQAVQDARQFQELQSSLGSELDRIIHAIPEDLTDREIMRTLSEEAKNVGLNISSITAINNNNMQSEQNEDFVRPVAATLELAGTYSQVMIFLSNLTRLNRIITIGQLSMATNTNVQNSSTPQIELKGDFVGYRFAPPPKATPEGSAN